MRRAGTCSRERRIKKDIGFGAKPVFSTANSEESGGCMVCNLGSWRWDLRFLAGMQDIHDAGLVRMAKAAAN
jgi:hypothetical protein